MRARHVKMTLARRFVTDLSVFSLGVPLGVMKRHLDLSKVRSARAASNAKVPWTVIMTRAYGRVANDMPELRRAYVKFPFPRIAEVDGSIATVMTEREIDGEIVILPAKLKFPGLRPLTELTDEFNACLSSPPEQTPHLRLLLGITRLPLPLRRLIWWLGFNMGLWRASYFGTFGVSVLGGGGMTIVRPISPLTTFLSYGPFQPDGTAEFHVGFDHRVMDGGTMVRALDRLQAELDGPVSDELRAMAGSGSRQPDQRGQIHQT
jgi:hypothetical protein